MALRIVWSDEATSDLDRIAQFIARDSPAYARTVVRRVLQSARKLGAFPFIGRVVPELGDEAFRELLVYSFRVLYLVEHDVVTIVCVAHARQSLSIDFEDDL
jgi:toxin ParE1/3/4